MNTIDRLLAQASQLDATQRPNVVETTEDRFWRREQRAAEQLVRVCHGDSPKARQKLRAIVAQAYAQGGLWDWDELSFVYERRRELRTFWTSNINPALREAMQSRITAAWKAARGYDVKPKETT